MEGRDHATIAVAASALVAAVAGSLAAPLLGGVCLGLVLLRVLHRMPTEEPPPAIDESQPIAAPASRDGIAVAGPVELAAEVDRRLPAATHERPLLVAVFDLADAEQYTKLFGAAAGDALLDRLGCGLLAAIGESGHVRRSGPTELTVIVELDGTGPDYLLAVAATALFVEGEGFQVGCSHGAVLLPLEAVDGREALAGARERMRDHREERRAGRENEAGETLVEAIRGRGGAEAQMRREIADLAEDTARKLGVPEGEIEQIRIAAGLHDVGKMAIPGSILQKPGPLDDEERRFMQRHTAIGERIVAAAPDLAEAAAMVRSIPERWDGSGYPDALSGPRIPLGSRVVAVCSAYDAMTTDRPYRRAMPVASALSELRRFAGIQFDPDVVEAFCLALLDHPPVER